MYSITITEVIDLIKDVAYCYVVNHTNHVLTILLWIFALFAFFYNLVTILIMFQNEYRKKFDEKDLKELEIGRYTNAKFLKIKIKRVLKEHFHIHNANERKDEQCSKRIKYSLFFIAIFENLP